ncbi:MAG: peptidylprolyl isomerase [Gammaproteobacteria bacterium]|nr:peptidylprolyl isomerase [Gammaproteobacteria bacterium]
MIARATILFAALLLAAAPGTALAGGAAAIVIELGDTAIARAAVDERFQVAVRLLARRQGVVLADQDPALLEQLRQQYLEKYATELILLREAGRRQIELPSSVVDQELSELFADDAELEAFLAEVASAGSAGHVLLRQVVRDEKLLELLNEHLLQEIKIPPGDVITLHHDVKDTLATPEQVCVRHIQSDSIEAAQQLVVELEQGASFEELARLRSTDAASAATGGDLGCFERSHAASRTEFEKAAFAAAEGDLTGPVESRLGYHILVVYDHRMPRAPTLNEAYAQIERELALEKLPQRIQTLVDNSGVVIYADRFSAAAE